MGLLFPSPPTPPPRLSGSGPRMRQGHVPSSGTQQHLCRLELRRHQGCAYLALPTPCSHSEWVFGVGMRPKHAKLASCVPPRRVRTRGLHKQEGSFRYYFRNTLWLQRAHFSFPSRGHLAHPDFHALRLRLLAAGVSASDLAFPGSRRFGRRQDAGRADSGPAARSSFADTASPRPRGPRHLPSGPAGRPGALGVDRPGRRGPLVGFGGSREVLGTVGVIRTFGVWDGVPREVSGSRKGA